MYDLNYFHLGYQDATEINLPAAWMNWLPMRGTDFTGSSPLTKSCRNNQNRPGQNSNGSHIQTIRDIDRRLTPGHKVPEADRQEGSQGEIEVWKPVRIMLATHSVPTKSRGSGLAEYPPKDAWSPPQNTYPAHYCSKSYHTNLIIWSKEIIKRMGSGWNFIIAIIRKQSPCPELPLTGRRNYDVPIYWATVIPLSQNCVTCTPTYRRVWG